MNRSAQGILFSEMRRDIQEELRLDLCRNCMTRSEPVFSPEPKICPLCGWIMINMTLAELSEKGNGTSGPVTSLDSRTE